MVKTKLEIDDLTNESFRAVSVLLTRRLIDEYLTIFEFIKFNIYTVENPKELLPFQIQILLKLSLLPSIIHKSTSYYHYYLPMTTLTFRKQANFISRKFNKIKILIRSPIEFRM